MGHIRIRSAGNGRIRLQSADAHGAVRSGCPAEIFVAFEGVARHRPPGGNDETLALGYLCLLQQLLERLRYRTDRGYADAARLIADFQADVAARRGFIHFALFLISFYFGFIKK